MTGLAFAPIVEGHGEVKAVPVLLRRIATELLSVPISVTQPWRVPKGRMTKATEMQRVVAASRMRVSDAAHVVVLLDADHDDPGRLRDDVIEACAQSVTCLVAVHEYEAWILAGWKADGWNPADCEQIRDAKGRLSRLMGRPYSEVRDQAGVTATFDLEAAQANSPSFLSFVEALRILAS